MFSTWILANVLSIGDSKYLEFLLTHNILDVYLKLLENPEKEIFGTFFIKKIDCVIFGLSNISSEKEPHYKQLVVDSGVIPKICDVF